MINRNDTTGADALLAALADEGVDVCFANPGTTELDLVRSLEREGRMRCVVGLQENVCTGGADGYGRMTGRPAVTLLHLGPGFANGIANLHNARRAHTPIVNIVGDHTSWHLPFDAPLTSDIESLARPVSGWVHRIAAVEQSEAAGREAVKQSLASGGQGATLIFPADYQAHTGGEQVALVQSTTVAAASTTPVAFDPTAAVQRLKAASRIVFLLGGGGEQSGLGLRAQKAVQRLCTALGATAYAETFPSRSERGQGLPAFDRLPYFPEPAREVLDPSDLVVLVGALPPVTYFGYEGHPSLLVQAERLLTLAAVGDDAATRLETIAELLGAADVPMPAAVLSPPEEGPLTPARIALALANQLPDRAIVSVEGGTCGYPFYAVSAAAKPHTTLTNTGGAIGQGLPVAMGAAIACPDRKVVALLSDGSTQYTIQTLWSLAHEDLDVVVLIAANHQYAILRNELRRGGAVLGNRAAEITSLDKPRIDWVTLAQAYGVAGGRANTSSELTTLLQQAFSKRGPMLIEMAL
ncbi:acetolactate synthase-1/2/3 large subunit [Hydrogenophaga palleronii]|uniref:Acetolactate synthase-1/2/3 large subunit n=1 Tax=Hydrogenophaga palleronii TaxID=65655 RepID=A0ABU1WS96_9BURK|nr:acetolactate synthase large subunit [Hydrogenophaga palleronii]MDR7151912.1 acetolactate synthase-1/2/3 large subunit [Hydrogenophaga palleronii]